MYIKLSFRISMRLEWIKIHITNSWALKKSVTSSESWREREEGSNQRYELSWNSVINWTVIKRSYCFLLLLYLETIKIYLHPINLAVLKWPLSNSLQFCSLIHILPKSDHLYNHRKVTAEFGWFIEITWTLQSFARWGSRWSWAPSNGFEMGNQKNAQFTLFF